MDHVRRASRWISIAVVINMLVALVLLIGLMTGAGLLQKLFGEGPVAQNEETIKSLVSVALMVVMALLGIVPGMVCNFVGGCSLCQPGAPDETRPLSTVSLVLFSVSILFFTVVAMTPSEESPGLHRTLQIIALFLAVGSHVSFLAVLRRIATEKLGHFMDPLFWTTLGLCGVTCLMIGLACLGWSGLFSTLGMCFLGILYLAWNGCYLAVLWQVGSRA